MAARILTFQVFVGRDSIDSWDAEAVYLRGSFNQWGAAGEARLEDAAGTGIYSANVLVEGNAGSQIEFKYVVKVRGEEIFESSDNLGGGNRRLTLGPADVATFVSAKPHVWNSLLPVAPQGIRTGGRALLLPIGGTDTPDAPCHGWFFDNFVAWDGNSPLTDAGIVYSTEPLNENGSPSGSAVTHEVSLGIDADYDDFVARWLSQGALGEFTVPVPNRSDEDGWVGHGASGGYFQQGEVIYYRAYANNAVGTRYGEQRQVNVPQGALREWAWEGNGATARVVAAENSTPMEKGAIVLWDFLENDDSSRALMESPGDWVWEIHRFTARMADTPAGTGREPIWTDHRLMAALSDADVVKNGSQRTWLDRSVLPGLAYLYAVGVRDAAGLYGFRTSRVEIPEWVVPEIPNATAQSQTPYSVTFSL